MIENITRLGSSESDEKVMFFTLTISFFPIYKSGSFF